MTEKELSENLDNVKAERRKTKKYTDKWAALCVEIGRLTNDIWRLRRSDQR